MSKNKNETLPDWVQDERDAYIDAIWPASKQSAPSIEPRPLGSIGDYAQFHTFLGAFAEAYKGLDEACGKDVFEAADNLTSAQNNLIDYINGWFNRLADPRSKEGHVPEGWKLVPISPTPEMQDAAVRAFHAWHASEVETDFTHSDSYRAMVDAS